MTFNIFNCLKKHVPQTNLFRAIGHDIIIMSIKKKT